MSFKSKETEVASQLKKDFKEFRESCMGILLFGSYAGEEPTKRSDIDVCMVKPSEGILDDILGKLGGKYDIKVFEKLDISEYFYFFRKLWRDMEHRITRNEFTDFAERRGYRRRWLNEKEKILGEAIERKGALEGK